MATASQLENIFLFLRRLEGKVDALDARLSQLSLGTVAGDRPTINECIDHLYADAIKSMDDIALQAISSQLQSQLGVQLSANSQPSTCVARVSKPEISNLENEKPVGNATNESKYLLANTRLYRHCIASQGMSNLKSESPGRSARNESRKCGHNLKENVTEKTAKGIKNKRQEEPGSNASFPKQSKDRLKIAKINHREETRANPRIDSVGLPNELTTVHPLSNMDCLPFADRKSLWERRTSKIN